MGQMAGQKIRIQRPRNDPRGLRKRAAEAGIEPVALVVQALSRNATYEAAAAELQVTTRALLRYRRHYGIEG